MTQDTRHDQQDESNALLPLDTSGVLLETASGGNSCTASPESVITTVESVGAAVVSGQERNNSVVPTTNDSAISGQHPQMKAPHISTLYKKKDVMAKHFGVTQKQALRTQALLRLGVTDEDVRIAERLMGPRSAGDNVSAVDVCFSPRTIPTFFFLVFDAFRQRPIRFYMKSRRGRRAA